MKCEADQRWQENRFVSVAASVGVLGQASSRESPREAATQISVSFLAAKVTSAVDEVVKLRME